MSIPVEIDVKRYIRRPFQRSSVLDVETYPQLSTNYLQPSINYQPINQQL